MQPLRRTIRLRYLWQDRCKESKSRYDQNVVHKLGQFRIRRQELARKDRLGPAMMTMRLLFAEDVMRMRARKRGLSPIVIAMHDCRT